MRKLLILFFFCYGPGLFAQLNFSEMKLLLSKNVSQIEDFLIAKNYLFYNQAQDGNCTDYDFALEKSNYNDNAKAFVTINVCGGNMKVYQSIIDQKVIPKIKSDAIAAGLVYIKTDNHNNDIVHTYRSSIYELLIMSTLAKEGMTNYEMRLSKM